MGVDSGLPDFRGSGGFWNVYPMYERLGINFVDAANPVHFERDPAFGWGFYGHRTDLYRRTVPHPGYRKILEWIDRFSLDFFVVTSNVDGHFQKAGFSEERILEVHGSIHHLQCCRPCSRAIWDNRENLRIDCTTMRAVRVPRCPSCGGIARPNILMFGDWSWISDRTDMQNARFNSFATSISCPGVVLEMGAGTAIPTIRHLSEELGKRRDVTVIRINPHEPSIPPPHVSIPSGALAGLQAIGKALS
jgi:NAD-dependent SIR2 family protein deacetylase